MGEKYAINIIPCRSYFTKEIQILIKLNADSAPNSQI